MTVAAAGLDAELWGEARVQLEALDEAQLTARACRLRARLEEAEHGDSRAARQWLERAASAPADPAWTCASCGAVATDWSAVCGHCGAFDTVGWAPPPRVSLLAPDELAAPQARIVEMPSTRPAEPTATSSAPTSSASAASVVTMTEPPRATG